MDEWRLEFLHLVSQWSSLLLQLQLIENPLWDFISSLFLFIEHLYSVSSNKSIQASKDFPWLQTQMEFASDSNPLSSKKKKFIKKDRILPWSLPQDEENAEWHIVEGKNPAFSMEARSKSRCQSGSGCDVKAKAWAPQCRMESVNIQNT